MSLATLSVLVALVFLLAGTQKILLRRAVTVPMRRLGAGAPLTRLIGTLEIAGALGLVAGIWFTPIALAAATGLPLLLIGAVGATSEPATTPTDSTAPAQERPLCCSSSPG
ncbi:putative membrane protein YphA (DoxX/SURF4 family) [Lipingzhangella halophila]|uniref:Putative membrane protein YphA (DoxX/SURF4 family) n=1 Tax=Lipingzhangella halophila TaxID=1783352 RepID=A0A7W7RCW4_9ACTN|nr:DoxX family protein [Lipingzhangella halophila]MBB4929676.1 putative membrane protein YphA (DoxX/SURF4 family) [Lipingzhangella halophila]